MFCSFAHLLPRLPAASPPPPPQSRAQLTQANAERERLRVTTEAKEQSHASQLAEALAACDASEGGWQACRLELEAAERKASRTAAELTEAAAEASRAAETSGARVAVNGT